MRERATGGEVRTKSTKIAKSSQVNPETEPISIREAARIKAVLQPIRVGPHLIF
jgi:hypothetical protein